MLRARAFVGFSALLFSASLLLPCSLQAATVTLLHYNDLHAHMTPHLDRIPDGPLGQTASGTRLVERGGLARIATVVKTERARNPNSVLMNIGDTFHGGVEALYTLGNAIVDPVNALGIDIGVPGNWDYAYGPSVTRLRYASLSSAEARVLEAVTGQRLSQSDVKKPSFQNLAANVTYTSPRTKAGQTLLPATWITTRAGVKLGFIGISSDIVPQMSSLLAYGLDFLQGEDNYRQLIERQAASLRSQGAQLVFVMSELGIHKDKRLADVIMRGSVDVFFSAHTHEATFVPLTGSSGALVVEAGNDGYLGRMDVTVGGAKPVFSWTLLPVDASIPEDANMKKLVDAARAPFLVANPNLKVPLPYADQYLHQAIGTVVGHTNGPLDRRSALDSSFNRVFSDGLRRIAGTQIALAPGFRMDAVVGAPGEVEDNTLANGDITIEDVYRFFPVLFTMATGQASGAQLKGLMEQNLTSVFSRDAFKQAGGWFDGFGGIGLVLNMAGTDGARIQSAWLTDTGNNIDDAAVYSVAGCQRPGDAADTLCSFPGFANVQAITNPATAAPWTIADMFVEMLNKGPFPATVSQITDTSATPVWPAAPFVQPLW